MATFGQRKAQGLASTNKSAAVSAQPHSREASVSDLDFVDVSLGERYAPGKDLWIIATLWALFGWLGAHRFYMEHWIAGFVVLAGPAIICFIAFGITPMAFVEVLSQKIFDTGYKSLWSGTKNVTSYCVAIFVIWVVVDGFYVLARKYLNF